VGVDLRPNCLFHSLESMSIVHIKYFDEDSGTWNLKHPSSAASSAPRSFSFATIAFGIQNEATDRDRCAVLSEALRAHQPTFVALQEVSPSLTSELASLPIIRKNYAMTDFVKYESKLLGPKGGVVQGDHGSIFLIRNGVFVDFAETLATDRNAVPFLALNLRQFCSFSVRLMVAHFDPDSSPEKRSQSVLSILQRDSGADVAIFAGNFFDVVLPQQDGHHRFQLNSVRDAQGFSEVTDGLEPPPISTQAHGLWLKQNAVRINPNPSMPLAQDATNCYRHASITNFAVKFSIPQPRSLGSQPNTTKTGKSPMLAPVAAGQLPTLSGIPNDPAILSMDEKSVTPTRSNKDDMSPPILKDGISVAALFPSAPKKRDRWLHSNVFYVRAATKLQQSEMAYDLSKHFSSVKEACDQLNSGAAVWHPEYFVVNGSIIGSDTIEVVDIKGFRKYVASRPAPPPLQFTPVPTGVSPTTLASPNVQVLLEQAKRKGIAPPVDVGGVDSDSTAVGQAVGAAQPSRVRKWSELSTSILYQVTPREMKFDITGHLGLPRNPLKAAVDRLNRRGQATTPSTVGLDGKSETKPDPLADYGYDYALVYCTERQAYWLLAATDVPCDIVACRHAAT